uniref:Protein ENHANCED DISEASE RESISTANCE 2-like isoform X2 n=1 Tax=Nicotiana tabacum TaxID=4097 RepID=A0A1S3Z5K0_TOBAC|nr:PREDICTED: protein ENHANCED DISEASE RESISTANCE 2-like isoform X2 [Nicotiana tabacum]
MAKHPLYVKLYLFHNPNSSHCFSLFHSPAILLCNSGGAGADHMSKVVYEGWMVRYGRRKIGKSYIHMRYFVLETRLLAYYKKKPQDNVVPVKTLLIDGNCRVEDRGLKTHHGHMAAFNILEALIWKEKIESVISPVYNVFFRRTFSPCLLLFPRYGWR